MFIGCLSWSIWCVIPRGNESSCLKGFDVSMGLRFLFKFQGFKLAEVNFIHTCGLAATGSAWSSCIQWPAYDILLHRHVQKLKPIQQDAAINCSTHQFISIHLSNTSAHYFHLSNASKLLDAFPHGRLHIFGAPAGGNPKVSALGIWTAAVRRTRWATRHRGITLRWIFEGKGHLGPGQHITAEDWHVSAEIFWFCWVDVVEKPFIVLIHIVGDHFCAVSRTQIGRFGKAFATSDLVKVNHSNRCGVTTSCSATLWQVLPSDPKCRGSSQESLPEGCEPGDNSANQGATLSFPDVMRWSCSNFGFVVATTVG